MRIRKTDDELPPELPFIPGQASNGEFIPEPRTRSHRAAEALAHVLSETQAKKQGIDRRRFLMSTAGIAVTLSALNLTGCDDDDKKGLPPGVESGGTYQVPKDADPDAVCAMLEGDEFIFDVQTHHVDPKGEWVRLNPTGAAFFRTFRPNCSETERLDCLSRYYYAHDIFMESDTSIAVLSDTPSPAERFDPLNFYEMRRTREIMNQLSPPSANRLRLHSIVVPNVGPLQAQLDQMQARAETLEVAAWKVYTPYGADGRGWWLDDERLGIPMIEQARRLGVKTICAHKGLPLQGFDLNHSSPRDIGVVAKAYPDMNFVVYHSGYYPGVIEGPYDEQNAERGTNTLVKSLLDNGIGPNQNVYAELGSTWRNVMSNRTQAAHLLGKLLKYVGEENVLWGTDCIWTGSPQPQIVAFRAFQMDAQFAQANGYAPLTPDVKRKVFGLNAARLYGAEPEIARCRTGKDEVERLRAAWRDVDGGSHEPAYAARGPIDRRGMIEWFRKQGGRWQL